MEHGTRIGDAATLTACFGGRCTVVPVDAALAGDAGVLAATFLRHVGLWAAQWELSCPEFQAEGRAELAADLDALAHAGLEVHAAPAPGAAGTLLVRVVPARR